jgi:hypothetical protein
MTKITVRKILGWSLSTVLLLGTILLVHIYMVTKPKPDKHTRILARIDIGQPVDSNDVHKIVSWLYAQPGVDHVMCNAKTSIAVFSFSPLQNDANTLAIQFSSQLKFVNARRFMPTAAQMKNACPVAPNSFAYKTYQVLTHIF